MSTYTSSISFSVMKGMLKTYNELIKFEKIDTYQIRDILYFVRVSEYDGFDKLTIEDSKKFCSEMDLLHDCIIFHVDFFSVIKKHIEIVEKYQNKNLYDINSNNMTFDHETLRLADQLIDNLLQRKSILTNIFSTDEINEIIENGKQFIQKHKTSQLKNDIFIDKIKKEILHK